MEKQKYLDSTLVIATRNPAKVEHYRNLFSGVIKSVIGLCDLNVEGKPEETGDTAESNAEIKAKYYSLKTDYPVFCEDECLYVDFLPADKQPGTHVRRINGKDEVTDDELLTYWEGLIRDVSPDKRTGYWHFAYCLANKGKIKLVTKDFPTKFYYPISPIRIPGWPLSSLQGSHGKPHSELNEQEKQKTYEIDSRQFLLHLVEDF
jgi:inosine/xanthosine triphosphate pyrophosphatase family protein